MTGLFDLVPTFNLPFRTFRNIWVDPFAYTVECADWTPVTDVAETDTAYVVTMEAPGIDMTKLDVTYSEGILTVKGEKVKESTEGESCHCTERYSGTFQRTVTVPGRVDKDRIDATYRDGVLKLTLPKSEEGKPRKIEVH